MRTLTMPTIVKIPGIATLLGGLLWLAAAGAQAQSWPAKTIRLVEPAGPGSAVDVFARRLAPLLADVLGQSVVIDNRPGANSAIGAREVARAAADGHTWLHANINNSLNDLLSSDSCCRLGDALVPVTRLTSTPLVMVVHPLLPANHLKEYIALAKAQPQLLTFASGGTGAVTQLLGEKIKSAAVRSDEVNGSIIVEVHQLHVRIAQREEARNLEADVRPKPVRGEKVAIVEGCLSVITEQELRLPGPRPDGHG